MSINFVFDTLFSSIDFLKFIPSVKAVFYKKPKGLEN